MPESFYIKPAQISALPGFEGLIGDVRSRREFERQKAEKAKQQDVLKKAASLFQTGTPDEISAFAIENPFILETLDKAVGFKSDVTKQNAIDTARDILINKKDPSQALIERAETVIQEGGDASGSINLAEQAQQDPSSAIREAEITLALYDPDSYEAYKQATTTGEVDTELKIGAQEILEDGSIIQSTPQGPVVYNPEGKKVIGKEAADTIKAARAEKVSNARKMSGEKKRASLEAEEDLKAKVESGVISAKEAAKISVNAFDRLEKINTGIRNIDEAIRLIDEGAQTGVIKSMLPSIRQASIKLDNLQGRLGLDVIGNTTFGALSGPELKFALDTALPQKLKGEELKGWLQEKKAAQEKLSDYIEAAAIFLGTPGNTVKDWVEQQRDKRTAAKQELEGKPPGRYKLNDRTIVNWDGQKMWE